MYSSIQCMIYRVNFNGFPLTISRRSHQLVEHSSHLICCRHFSNSFCFSCGCLFVLPFLQSKRPSLCDSRLYYVMGMDKRREETFIIRSTFEFSLIQIHSEVDDSNFRLYLIATPTSM